MAFKKSDFSYTVGDLDETFDEKNNQFLALRKIKWGSNESAEYKLDIRKWSIDKEGKEVCCKGVSMLTEDGADNLVHALVSNGYGDTADTLNDLSRREDFIPSLSKVLSPDQIKEVGLDENVLNSTDTYYNPDDLLSDLDEESE